MVKTKRGLPNMTWIAAKELYRLRGTYKDHKYSITGKTPEIVVEKIEAFKAQVDGSALDDTTTVWAYIQRWYPLKAAGLKPKSADVYKNAIHVHIVPKIGNMLLKDVRPIHIDEVLASMSGMSASMNRKTLFTLSQIFKSAVENNLIQRNPCDGRKAGGIKARIKTPLTREQQQTLTEAVRETRAELFVLLCLYAGLRREEALGLLWGNVHLDCAVPYLDVRHTVTFTPNGRPTHSTSLKTNAAYRSVPLPPQLSEALIKYKGRKDSLFVIPAETTGLEMTLTAFRRMWQITTKAVDFHVEPHQLRHTYITELCASGMDIKKIQYLAGHATVQMTLNVYSHVTQNKPEQLAPDIIRIFPGTPPGIPADKSESLL